MSTAKQVRQALRRLDEAKNELNYARYEILAWSIVSFFVFVASLSLIVLQFYITDKPVFLGALMIGGLGGFGLFAWGFDTYGSGFRRLRNANKSVRNATYDWEDISLGDDL